MKLGEEQLQQLKAGISSVYEGYLSLDFGKNRRFIQVQNRKLSLAEWMAYENPNAGTYPVTIAGSRVNINVVENDDSCYTVKIDNPEEPRETSSPLFAKLTSRVKALFLPPLLPIKKKSAYNSDEEVLDLLSGQTFTCEIQQNNGETTGCLGLYLNHNNHEVHIGSVDKIELYSMHLDTLYNIAEHIERTGVLGSNILIALATGSGKTFIQALLYLIAYLSDLEVVFVLPGNLIAQFKGDLERLLPSNIVDAILEIKSPDTVLEQGKSAVVSHEMLDKKAPELLNLCSGKTLFTVDEVHKIVINERKKRVLSLLQSKYLTTLLTATPDRQSYQKAGKPVATMSNKQKQKNGQGSLPEIIKTSPKCLAEKSKATSVPWKKRALYYIVNVIEPEKMSSGIAALEKLEYVASFVGDSEFNSEDRRNNNGLALAPKIVPTHQNRWQTRWKLQVPMARPMLILCDDTEELLNISAYLNHEITEDPSSYKCYMNRCNPITGDPKSIYIWRHGNSIEYCITNSNNSTLSGIIHDVRGYQALNSQGDPKEVLDYIRRHDTDLDYKLIKNFGVYKGQNLFNRHDVFRLLSVEEEEQNPEVEVSTAYHNAQLAERDVKVQQCPEAPSLPCLQKQLEYTVVHGLVNVLIRDLTGLDNIALDKLRFNDLESLVLLVIRAMDQRGYLKENSPESQAQSIKTYFFNKLCYSDENRSGIDANGATQVASILYDIIVRLRREIEAYPNDAPSSNRNICNFVDNWHCDAEMCTWLINETGSSTSKALLEFARNHRTLFVLNARTGDVEVKGGSAVSYFSSKSYPLFVDGKFNGEAKECRHHESRELMSPETREHRFSPQYTRYNEIIADNYAKLGLVGAYISDRKCEGYSDASLQTVLAVNNTDPEKQLQGAGRNRGLNPLVKPVYIESVMPGTKELLDMKALNERKDYLPMLFKATERHMNEVERKIAAEIVEEIKMWLIAHVRQSDEMDYLAIQDEVGRILVKKFKQLNDQNHHEIEMTKQHFARMLNFVMTGLENEAKWAKQPLSTSKIVRGTRAVTAIFLMFYSPKKRLLRQLSEAIRQVEDVNGENNPVSVNRLYCRIIEKSDFCTLDSIRLAIPSINNQVMAIMQRMHDSDVTGLLTQDLEENLRFFLREGLIPLLVKFFPPDREQEILQLALASPDWGNVIFVLFDHYDLLSRVEKHEDSDSIRSFILNFFKQFRYCRHLTAADMKYDRWEDIEATGNNVIKSCKKIWDNTLQEEAVSLLTECRDFFQLILSEQSFLQYCALINEPECAAKLLECLLPKMTQDKFSHSNHAYVLFCELQHYFHQKHGGDLETVWDLTKKQAEHYVVSSESMLVQWMPVILKWVDPNYRKQAQNNIYKNGAALSILNCDTTVAVFEKMQQAENILRMDEAVTDCQEFNSEVRILLAKLTALEDTCFVDYFTSIAEEKGKFLQRCQTVKSSMTRKAINDLLKSPSVRQTICLRYRSLDATAMMEILDDADNAKRLSDKMLELNPDWFPDNLDEMLQVFSNALSQEFNLNVVPANENFQNALTKLDSRFKDIDWGDIDSVVSICSPEKFQDYFQKQLNSGVPFKTIKLTLDATVKKLSKDELGHILRLIKNQINEELADDNKINDDSIHCLVDRLLWIHKTFSENKEREVFRYFVAVVNGSTHMKEFQQLWTCIVVLHNEMLLCHRHFTATQKNGLYARDPVLEGTIVKQTAAQIQNVRDDQEREVQRSWRKVASTTDGISLLGSVTGHGNAAVANTLSQVGTFMVRPVINVLERKDPYAGTSSCALFQAKNGVCAVASAIQLGTQFARAKCLTTEEALDPDCPEDAIAPIAEKLKPATGRALMLLDRDRKFLVEIVNKLYKHKYEVGFLPFGGKIVTVGDKRMRVTTGAYGLMEIISRALDQSITYTHAREEVIIKLTLLTQRQETASNPCFFWQRQRRQTTRNLYNELHANAVAHRQTMENLVATAT